MDWLPQADYAYPLSEEDKKQALNNFLMTAGLGLLATPKYSDRKRGFGEMIAPALMQGYQAYGQTMQGQQANQAKKEQMLFQKQKQDLEMKRLLEEMDMHQYTKAKTLMDIQKGNESLAESQRNQREQEINDNLSYQRGTLPQEFLGQVIPEQGGMTVEQILKGSQGEYGLGRKQLAQEEKERMAQAELARKERADEDKNRRAEERDKLLLSKIGSTDTKLFPSGYTTPEGIPMMVDRLGNMVPAKLPQGTGVIKPPTGEQKDANAILADLKQKALWLQENKAKRPYAGLGGGMIAGAKRTVNAVTPEQNAYIMATNDLKEYLFSKGGKALTAPELEQLTPSIPTLDRGSFDSDIDSFIKKIDDATESRKRTSGYVPTKAPLAPGTTNIVQRRNKTTGEVWEFDATTNKPLRRVK